jgi:hypothetical protein
LKDEICKFDIAIQAHSLNEQFFEYLTWCVVRTSNSRIRKHHCFVLAAWKAYISKDERKERQDSMKLFRLLFSTLIAAAVAGHVHGLDEDTEVLRWSSAGGSFRNLVANMGYANVFAKGGLFGQEESSSKFTALSGQSGGSWFAAFFFYSIDFYRNTTQSSPEDLATFVRRAMGSYREYSATYYQDDPLCHQIAKWTLDADAFVAGCGILVALDGSWADLNEGVTAAIAAEFGINDIEQTAMNRENRVAPLATTDMYLQMTMLPSSRVHHSIKSETISHLGLKGANSVYSVPIDVQWSVTDDYAAFVSNTPNGTAFPSEMVTYEDVVPPLVFPFTEAKTYEVYPPGKTRSVFANVPKTATLSGPVRVPFGGLTPTISQITAASTSVPGFYASSVPSTMAQVVSTLLPTGSIPGIGGISLAAVQAMLTPTYQTKVLDDLAVCSQWPMAKCDVQDVRLADGYAADAPTAALNIGQYQTMQNGDLSKTIKLILTPPNINPNPRSKEVPLYLLSYFETSFNQDVEPGDFLWPSEGLIVPLRSPQIFADYLDAEGYNSMLNRVNDTSELRTARIETVTIDNPTYLVKGGQKVDILILQLASRIPLGIVGVKSIDQWTEPLAYLMEEISGSQNLLAIVQDFVS